MAVNALMLSGTWPVTVMPSLWASAVIARRTSSATEL